MEPPKRERYVVAFEVTTQFGDIQHRGEIDFASYDEAHLDFPMRGVLGLIGQPGSCCKQYDLRAHATKLWKIGRNGERTEVPIPKEITECEAGPVSHRDVLTEVKDLTCTCGVPAECGTK